MSEYQSNSVYNVRKDVEEWQNYNLSYYGSARIKGDKCHKNQRDTTVFATRIKSHTLNSGIRTVYDSYEMFDKKNFLHE
jgi:hypothetical protein